MNKQEFRMKDKHRSFKPQKAPVIDKPDTSLSGAFIDNNTLENSILDDLCSGFQESTSKAPEKKNSYNKVLISAIIISAVAATLIALSGAK